MTNNGEPSRCVSQPLSPLRPSLDCERQQEAMRLSELIKDLRVIRFLELASPQPPPGLLRRMWHRISSELRS